jgi:hypothetical protein
LCSRAPCCARRRSVEANGRHLWNRVAGGATAHLLRLIDLRIAAIGFLSILSVVRALAGEGRAKQVEIGDAHWRCETDGREVAPATKRLLVEEGLRRDT